MRYRKYRVHENIEGNNNRQTCRQTLRETERQCFRETDRQVPIIEFAGVATYIITTLLCGFAELYH